LDPWLRIERVTARGRETMASATEEELFLTPGSSPEGRGVSKDR
jgi:hypothetical protein